MPPGRWRIFGLALQLRNIRRCRAAGRWLSACIGINYHQKMSDPLSDDWFGDLSPIDEALIEMLADSVGEAPVLRLVAEVTEDLTETLVAAASGELPDDWPW